MPNEMEKTYLHFKIEKNSIKEDGTFSGYASIFGNRDDNGNIVFEGAFDKTLKKRMPKLLWQHDTRKPIGLFTKAEVDSKGLKVEGKLLLDIQQAREAYTLLKEGAVEGLSIGFIVTKYKWADEKENDKGITRHIFELELFEASIVTYPANPKALIKDVNSKELKAEDISNIRELEKFLSKKGLTNSEQKIIIRKQREFITNKDSQKDSEEIGLGNLNELLKIAKSIDDTLSS